MAEEVIVLTQQVKKFIPKKLKKRLKENDAVFDCLVVGVDDPKFGQKVVAVVSLEDKKEIENEDLINATRSLIAGYKLPKQIIFVDEVQRAPNGKANYKWAKNVANENQI